jgi:hypothetical protein
LPGDLLGQRTASPVRLTLASHLGHDIDGAWWPHTAKVARELPELVGVLHKPLGQVIQIRVNWSSAESSPDLNWHGWEARHQRLMVITGRNARVNLLVVPHLTSLALAVMVMRQAAGLRIDPAHRETRAFHTAVCVVSAARAESALWSLRMGKDRRRVTETTMSTLET